MALDHYKSKRDFSKTPEPAGRVRRREGRPLSFMIHKHDATRLHYDLRLELDGVLKSWAVPKGPSLDPRERRLAVHVEDHPLEYGEFEGTIPKGEYGGGTVMLWDRGIWRPRGPDPLGDYQRGALKFDLEGDKLRGGFMLVRLKSRGEEKDNWLLIKEKDEAARSEGDILEERLESVASGRGLEEIAAAGDAVWSGGLEGEVLTGAAAREKAAPKKTAPRKSPAKKATPKKAAAKNAKTSQSDATQVATELPAGARAGSMPSEIGVQLATPALAAPEGEAWLHEIKLDGYRIVARIDGGRVRLLSRNGKDWTAKFGGFDERLARLAGQAIVDGEMTLVRRDGTTDFQSLVAAAHDGHPERLTYFAFDLLHLDGHDLRAVPLIERKQLLEGLIGRLGEPTIRISDHIRGQGPEFYEQACRSGLEGIVSKLATAPYRAARNRDWLKVKCSSREEFVIGGFTDPKGSAKGLGALLLGQYDGEGRLAFCGRVGTGFSDRLRLELARRLAGEERATPPFEANLEPLDRRGVHWVKPRLVAEVRFWERTEDGILRHPSFMGLREDKAPPEARPEQPIAPPPAIAAKKATAKEKPSPPPAKQPSSRPARKGGAIEVGGVRLTSPDKILYPEQNVTKQAVAEYYLAVADWIMPHLAGRPLSLVRCPEGRHKECFFQKHAATGLEGFGRIEIVERSATREYFYLKRAADLVALAQMGALELHTWNARADRIDQPDMFVIDLDPDPTVSWDFVREVARRVRDRLAGLGLVSFLKTTGGKGLHVVAPLARRQGWDEVYEFTRALAQDLVREDPQRLTANMSKAKRGGKVYVDYVRNARGATSIAPYSTRRHAGATVAVALGWEELERLERPDIYTIKNLPRRLAGLKADPWGDYLMTRQSITQVARKKLGMK